MHVMLPLPSFQRQTPASENITFPATSTVMKCFVYSYLDVSFAVRTRDTTTTDVGDVIPFDDVISNAGNAYVTSGSDRGKFIAPLTGSYKFNVILMTFPGNGKLFWKIE